MLFSFDERMDEWTEIYTCDELTFSIDVDVNVDATKNEIGMKRRRKEKKCWKSWIVVGGRWLFCSFVRSHFESFRAQFREWIAADQQRKEEREKARNEKEIMDLVAKMNMKTYKELKSKQQSINHESVQIPK